MIAAASRSAASRSAAATRSVIRPSATIPARSIRTLDRPRSPSSASATSPRPGALGPGEQDARRAVGVVERARDLLDPLGVHHDVGPPRRELADPDQAVDQLVDVIVAAQEADDAIGEPGRPHRRRQVPGGAERHHAEPAQRGGVGEAQQDAVDGRRIAGGNQAGDRPDVVALAREVVARVGEGALELVVELGGGQQADDHEVELGQREHADQPREQRLGLGGERVVEPVARRGDLLVPGQVVIERHLAAERDRDLLGSWTELVAARAPAALGVHGEVPRQVSAGQAGGGSVGV